jgi:hypothetical protein
MGQRTDQIESQISDERSELRANLDELGARVRSATDWRHQFRNNAMLGLSLAFGGGLLLASLLRSTAGNPRSTGSSDGGRGQLLHTWEAIQSALIGVTATKVTDVLANLVPGFREHLERAAHVRTSRHGNGHGVQGEGNYDAARRYRAGVEKFVRTTDVGAAARAAEPRNESEAEELEAAEEEGRARGRPS